jgi:tetratricopeptide (TPR) repeat protein
MTELNPDKRRKYPRVKVPKGMFVGWKSPGHHTASRAQELGLGGLFVYTLKPAAVGSTVELVFDVATGEVRARAVVRNLRPGVGMGLQFVQMRPEDRARLNRFLMSQQAAGVAPPDKKSDRPVEQSTTAGPTETAEQVSFERELKQLLELAQKGTYYQLLGVTTESTAGQIKKNFYSLARKFHPDHHMAGGESVESLQRLMEVVTQAYKTLTDEEKRLAYDKGLAVSGAFTIHRGKTEWRETVEDCLGKANECLRVRNFVGSVIWLRKCVAIAPNDAKYHAMLARSLGTVPQYRHEAIEHFETAIELDPWNLKVHSQFAELCEEMQLNARARGLYAKILEIDPAHAKSLEKLAQFASREKGAKSSSVISRMFDKRS